MSSETITIPGHGETKIQVVGGAHTSAIDVMVGRPGLRFAVHLDEALQPHLVRIPYLLEPPSGNLEPLVEAARRHFDANATTRMFLTVGRIEMDSLILKQELDRCNSIVRQMNKEPNPKPQSIAVFSQQAEAHARRLRDMEKYKKALLEWTKAPGKSDLPTPKAHAVRPHGLELGTGTVAKALASGEVASFRNDPLNRIVTEAIMGSFDAGHPMVGFSHMKDAALYVGLTNKDPRYAASVRPATSLTWMIIEGLVTDDDLIVVECMSPMVTQAEPFLTKILSTNIDPVVVVFDAATVHVGKASKVLAALTRQPSLDEIFVMIETQMRDEIADAGSIGLGRYLEIVDGIAERYRMDGDEVSIAFQDRHGDDFSIQMASAPGP